MANRGKMRQIEDVIRSKIVVEIGVFYYRCPCVTLGDLECRWFESGRQIVKERIEDGANEKAALRFPITALSFASISIFPG